MFDKLIESNSAEADFKARRKFFMMSFVVVGILFVSALMIDLYAQELNLGTEEFELAAIIAPVMPEAPEPKQPRQPQTQSSNEPKSDVPVRNQLIDRLATSTKIPDSISTTPSKYKEIPWGPMRIAPGPETDGIGSDRSYSNTGTTAAQTAEPAETEVVKIPPPPPITKAEPKKVVTQSKGVINGFAIDLPKPNYSAAARAINLTGRVNVQVSIDESGKVVSAKVVDGHMLFARDAEQAARRAKFRPTYLGDQAVRVTGVIVYNFTR